MPFEITNRVAGFQRILDEIIEKESLKVTFISIDDVTICDINERKSDTKMTRFKQLAEKYGFALNKSKWVNRVTKIKVLGCEVSKGTIRLDPEWLRPLQELPRPDNIKAQRRIVGMFAHYSRWILSNSLKIHELINNSIFFVPDKIKDSTEYLKRELENVIVHPTDMRKNLEIDPSYVNLAAMLNQSGRIVAFWSRTLNLSERDQFPVEKESNTILKAIRKWEIGKQSQFTWKVNILFLSRTKKLHPTFLLSIKFLILKTTKFIAGKLNPLLTNIVNIDRVPKNACPDALTRVHCSSDANMNLKKITW